MVVNGYTISEKAYQLAEKKCGKVPSTLDSLVEQNKFLKYCAAFQQQIEENEKKLNNVEIKD